MSVEIKPITDEDAEKWDDFILNHRDGNIYHHSVWRQVLQQTYGYQPLYLALQNTSTREFEGAFPVMHIKSFLTGERLISLPFSSFCPLLVPDDAVKAVVDFSMAQYPKAEFLALKLCESDKKVPDFLRKDSSYVTHFVDLTVGESELLKEFHATSVRQRITRASRDKDLTFRIGQSEDDLKKFFKLHTHVRKKHGLPPHPYQFFLNMWRLMAPRNMLYMPFIEHQGKMVAAAIVFTYKDTVSYEYSATHEDYFNMSANQLLAWEVMRKAVADGLAVFDWGRSALDNQSLIEYKDRWGARRCALDYYYYPDVNRLGAEGSRGRQLLTCANRLLPDILLQLEGRLLYRHMG